MSSRGVRVALGTDSRASNPDLKLWEEMRFIAQHDSNISPAAILRMATQAGAAALGLENECGVLAPGFRADLTIVQIPNRQVDDPHELVLEDASRVLTTYFAGALQRESQTDA
jgi:cytosine/adenosine deaminase-related metal-dependent hydrolase